ncbi:MAG: hypothetical protein JNL47_11785 [Bacteroidia bacterium]|nr:hypothetical protein [Bacteroidia bacterium]
MKISTVVILFALTAVLSSCLKDRSFAPPEPAGPGPGGKDSIVYGTLVVNEFLARGSTFYNELVPPGTIGGGADWIEIFNTTYDTILMEANRWYITDSLGDNKKYELPELAINPRSFLIVWADGFDTVITQIHASFGLNKDGEDLALFYKRPADDVIIPIDTLTFGMQQSGVSFGRLPDGSTNWSFFSSPTPGSANQ